MNYWWVQVALGGLFLSALLTHAELKHRLIWVLTVSWRQPSRYHEHTTAAHKFLCYFTAKIHLQVAFQVIKLSASPHLREPSRSSRWTARMCWPGTLTTASVCGSRALCLPPCLSGKSGRQQEAWTHTLTHTVTHSHVMSPSFCVDPQLLQQSVSPL